MTVILALETATDVVGCAVGIAEEMPSSQANDIGNASAGSRDSDIANRQAVLASGQASDTKNSSTSGGPVTMRASKLVRSERSHGEMLAPMIQAVLAEAEMSIADIGLIAVDCGPGRYTGLRVGIATAAALAYARSLPVAAVSSTELLAFGARKFNGYIVPVVDARRGEVFYAVYRGTGHQVMAGHGDLAEHGYTAGHQVTPGHQVGTPQNHRCPEEIVSPKVGNSADVAVDLSQHEGKKLLLGDGIFEVGPVEPRSLKESSKKFETKTVQLGQTVQLGNEIAGGKVIAASPSPSSLVVLAAQKAEAGQVCEYSDLKSLYLRQPDINTARKSTAGNKTDISAATTRKAAAP